jgi:hypothetical protein
MHAATRILFSLYTLSCGLEAHREQKKVQIVGNALIEAVKLATFLLGEVAIAGKGLEKTSGERSIDTLEQLQEEHANGIAFVHETVTTRVRQFFHQAFGSEFRKVVAQGGQRVLGLGPRESKAGG